MIIIKNREMLIPDNEQHIGTTYDASTEKRIFKILRVNTGIDLADLTFNLDLQYPDATKDTTLLTKNVTDSAIFLTWDITNRQLSQEGTLFVQMRAYDENVTAKWSSFKAPFYVEGHFQTPKHYSGDLSELEQIEAKIASFSNAETVREANEAVRKDNEEARITAETARAAAEAERETAFTDAIDDFNRDRQDLEDMRDGAVDAATQAAIYKDLCETYADVIVPVLYVDFTDGILKYNDNSSFEFTVNRTNGQLEYELTQGA